MVNKIENTLFIEVTSLKRSFTILANIITYSLLRVLFSSSIPKFYWKFMDKRTGEWL